MRQIDLSNILSPMMARSLHSPSPSAERADRVGRILLRPLAAPLGALYERAMTFRRRRYASGGATSRHLSRPVVSVGNLTMGGTGKTPMAILLARALSERGYGVSVLSRGYGGRRARDPMPVNASSAFREVGDEPLLIARSAPRTRVTVGRRRYEAGVLAEEEGAVDLHILDDGFQHLALHRDLDIVMLREDQPIRSARCLPAGPYREPPSALSYADVVVVKSVDGILPADLARDLAELMPRGATLHGARLRPAELVPLLPGDPRSLDWLRGRPILAFAGIGEPWSFRDTLATLGARLVDFQPLPDHHPYSDREVSDLEARARTGGAEAIVTTMKDLARMSAREGGPPVLGLSCNLEVEGLPAILERIENILSGVAR